MNINIFLPSLAGGGAEKAAAIFAKYCHQQHENFNCTIFLMSKDDVYSDKLDLKSVLILPKGLIKKIEFLRVNTNKNDINIIYLSTIRFVSLLYLANRRKNIYAFLQNPLKEAILLKKQNFVLNLLRTLLLKWTYIRLVCRVFAIAPGIKDELLQLGVTNCDVIPNPTEQMATYSPKRRKKHKNSIQIISAGRLHTQKNYIKMLKALRYLNFDFELSIYGDGPERDLLERYINSNGWKTEFFYWDSRIILMKNFMRQIYFC